MHQILQVKVRPGALVKVHIKHPIFTHNMSLEFRAQEIEWVNPE